MVVGSTEYASNRAIGLVKILDGGFYCSLLPIKFFIYSNVSRT